MQMIVFYRLAHQKILIIEIEYFVRHIIFTFGYNDELVKGSLLIALDRLGSQSCFCIVDH